MPEASAAPAPRKPRAPRRPRAIAPAPPAEPARSRWLARWFGPCRGLSAWFGREPFPDTEHLNFTPQAFPGLSTEACAILNTPLEDCDPEIVSLLLAGVARYLAANLPPELGMTDAGAVFSTLWGRLGALQAAVAPDALPDGAPDASSDNLPDVPSDAASDAPSAMAPNPAPGGKGAAADLPPDVSPALQPDPAPAATHALADAPSTQPPASFHAQRIAAANDAATIARDTTPAVTRTAPGFRGRSLRKAGRPFRRHRRAPIHRRHQRVHHGLRDTPHTRPPQTRPPRRLCYAACAGPP